jgi:hypothetical protein
MGAEDLVSNDANVAVVEYHSGGGGDPYINTFSDARVAYYGISGFPTAVFDGILSFVGGSNSQSMYGNYLPIFQERAAIRTAFSIEVFGENVGNNYSLHLRVTKLARIANQHLVLHAAVTESGISYNWQGQNHLEWVERTMAPDNNGTVLDFSTGDVQVINVNFVRNTAWVVNELEIASFIQDTDSREILQATKRMVSALQPLAIGDDGTQLPLETKLVGNYPNPFNPTTTIEFSLKESGNVRLDVFNVLGQKVKTLVNSQMNAGNHSIVWDGRDANGSEVSSGVYFVKLNTDNYTSTRKMLLTK